MVQGPCPWNAYFVDHVRAMFGPCWGHAMTKFTSLPARVMKFSRLSQHELRPMSMEHLIFLTMPGPCLDHVVTIISLALLPYELEL